MIQDTPRDTRRLAHDEPPPFPTLFSRTTVTETPCSCFLATFRLQGGQVLDIRTYHKVGSSITYNVATFASETHAAAQVCVLSFMTDS